MKKNILPLFILLFLCNTSEAQIWRRLFRPSKPGNFEIPAIPKFDELMEDATESTTHIVIISDSLLISAMKMEVLETQFAPKSAANDSNLSLVKRYLKGDTTTLPLIVKQLRGQDSAQRIAIYDDLYLNGTELKLLQTPMLANALFQNMREGLEAATAVQLAGYNKIPGYQTQFENYLMEGGNVEDGRLFYWLGEDGKNSKALSWMCAQISAGKIDLKKDYWIMAGMESYAENNFGSNRQMCLEISRKILHDHLLPQKDFETLKSNNATSNPANSVAKIILKYGDKTDVAFAEKLYKKGVLNDLPLMLLIDIDAEKLGKKIYKEIESEHPKNISLDVLTKLYNLQHDARIPIYLLERFEEENNYVGQNTIDALIEMKADSFCKKAAFYIDDKNKLKEFKDSYALLTGNIEDMVNDLTLMGVIAPKNELKVLQKALADSSDYQSHRIYINKVLDASGIYTSIDLESVDNPIDYPKYVRDLLALNANKSNDTLIGFSAKMQSDSSSYDYQITYFTNKKAYIIHPSPSSYYLDITSLVDLLNIALSDVGLEERYVMLYNDSEICQIVFGKPAAVDMLNEKYQISY